MSGLRDDLRRLTRGAVLDDPVSREVYATSACLYRIVPAAVVRPATADEIAPILAYAAERGIPVTARGAGSSVAGQALGSGIILDLAKHLNRIESIDPERRLAVVQPGVVLADLNRALSPHGLCFPPDPSSGDYATLGGMIANNSSGARSFKFGDTRTWVERLEVALTDGSSAWVGEVEETGGAGIDRIRAGMAALLAEHGPAIERSRPRVKKNSSGYHVWDLITDGRLNLAPLIVGSEGTLAVVTRAELKLAPALGGAATMLIVLGSLAEAGEAVARLRELDPAAIEIMDELFIRVVRDHEPGLRPYLPEGAAALLLVEFLADNQTAADTVMEDAAVFAQKLPGALAVFPARSAAEAKKLWAVRKAASPILYRLPGRRLTRFVEDVVFPPERVPEGIAFIHDVLARHGTEAPALGHAGSGNLHLNPRLNLERPEDLAAMSAIADEIYRGVIAMGGSITGEHGDGRLRAGYVAVQFPELAPLFRAIKKLFDPAGILNPGVKLSEAPHVPTAPLRQRSGTTAAWPHLNDPDLIEMLRRCHGCGHCRSGCPAAEASGEEEALPRAKVSLARALADGAFDPAEPGAMEGIARLVSLCAQCRRCAVDCPTGIEAARAMRAIAADMPRPARRALREALIARGPALLRAGGVLPGAAKALAENPLARSAIAKVFAIDPAAPLYLPVAEDLSPGPATAADAKPLIYYPGCLVRFTDAEGERRAALELFAALGYRVETPDLPCCGEAKLIAADLDGARRDARRFLDDVRPLLESGAPLVTTCHNCLFTFRRDYPLLVGPEAEVLRRAAVSPYELWLAATKVMSTTEETAIEVAAAVAAAGEAGTRNLLYLPGCRREAMKADDERQALSQLPGISLQKLSGLCCGLAGVYGVREESAEMAMKMGDRLKAAVKAAGIDEIVSGCPSCRMQLRRLGLQPVNALRFFTDNLYLRFPNKQINGP